MATFTTFGALAGLVLAIVLVLRKIQPSYALVAGALVGGILGGGGLVSTVGAMVSGAQGMMPTVLRILVSGVLVGALVGTGSATRLARAITDAIGPKMALGAIALATLLTAASGVFIDIAIITLAPLALAVGRVAGLHIPAILLAMVGGGKAGNIISPNPNTIAVSEAFGFDVVKVMAANIVPAMVSLAVTVLLAGWIERRCAAGKWMSTSTGSGQVDDAAGGPPLAAAISGPATTILLLSLGNFFGLKIDPMVALPAGGLVCIVACGHARRTIDHLNLGFSKVAGVSILLVGTGTIAGIIRASGLNADLISLLSACHLPIAALAPLSSVLLSGATGSTVAGVTLASQTFATTLVEAGVPSLWAAAALHAGGTIFDALPHGSFFHATAGSVGMSVRERLRIFPYGTLVGLTSTVVSSLMYIFYL